jgi:murein DD-endopeptidase MepM/ murein hydrolase activator NlpD
MQRSPRSSAASIAAVRPIDLPEVRDRRPRGSARHAAEPGVPHSDPRFVERPAPFQPPPLRPVQPPPYAAHQASSYGPPAGAPVDAGDPRFPLLHQEEPLAFGGDVLRRAATAVEPAIAGRSVRQPRTVHLAGTAAALVAAAIVLIAALKIAETQRVRAKQTASAESSSDRTPDGPRMTRVALSAEESSKIFHRKSAEYRDRWRSDVWFHPLTGEMRLPENPTRKFGAKRHGKRPIECGRGHCGVDVGEFGLTVHAVRDGTLERVQRRPKDNAGKYIRIHHDDGFISYYIHLNSIREDLVEGMRVKGGEEIGVTGKTGIRKSRPHLHFALAYRDGKEKVFVDPEPLLRRSVSASALDDVAAAEAADASIVASAPPALDDDVETGREHQVHHGRDQHSSEDDRPE